MWEKLKKKERKVIQKHHLSLKSQFRCKALFLSHLIFSSDINSSPKIHFSPLFSRHVASRCSITISMFQLSNRLPLNTNWCRKRDSQTKHSPVFGFTDQRDQSLRNFARSLLLGVLYHSVLCYRITFLMYPHFHIYMCSKKIRFFFF